LIDQYWVVLDRDGTIIQERNYLSDLRQVELIPGSAEGLRQLQNSGLQLVMITNQSGIGRGYFSLQRLKTIHQKLVRTLNSHGVRLEHIYFCPHLPSDRCQCRKPRTALLDRAAKDLHLDPANCFVIGDKASDIEMGKRSGATTFLVCTGYGYQVSQDGASNPDFVANDLFQAAAIVNCLVTKKEASGGVRPKEQN